MFRSILKKLVRKKVVKLGLVGTSLLGLMISSGFSFAKYIDTNYGNGNAGTAKFDGGTITFVKTVYHQSSITSDDLGIYAHFAEFRLDFESEVASEYSLEIKFGEYGTGTWDEPGNTDYSFYYNSTTQSQPYTVTIDDNDGTCTLVKDNVGEIFFGSGQTFSMDTVYVYESTDGVNYSLYKNKINDSSSRHTLSSDGTTLTLATNREVGFTSSYYFKFIFFIDIGMEDISSDIDNSSYSGSIEKCSILYHLSVEQVQ